MGSIEFSYTDPLVKATHPHHLVQFYENECVLEASVHTFISEGFKNGEGAIIVATQAHREMFLRRLKGDNVPTDELEKNGQLVLLDAEETLSGILKNDFPEHAAFERVIGRVLDEARAHGFPKTRVYGEMVNLLWQKGREEAAIRLEEYWNKIIQRRSFTLFCAYAVN